MLLETKAFFRDYIGSHMGSCGSSNSGFRSCGCSAIRRNSSSLIAIAGGFYGKTAVDKIIRKTIKEWTEDIDKLQDLDILSKNGMKLKNPIRMNWQTKNGGIMITKVSPSCT